MSNKWVPSRAKSHSTVISCVSMISCFFHNKHNSKCVNCLIYSLEERFCSTFCVFCYFCAKNRSETTSFFKENLRSYVTRVACQKLMNAVNVWSGHARTSSQEKMVWGLIKFRKNCDLECQHWIDRFLLSQKCKRMSGRTVSRSGGFNTLVLYGLC